MKLISKIKELISKSNKSKVYNTSISIQNGNLVYSFEDFTTTKFQLNSVLEVFVFKRDLFYFGCICIVFRIYEENITYRRH